MTKLYWIDIETTGLRPTHDRIVEIALARADLSSPFEVEWLLHSPIRQRDWNDVDEFVYDMHTKNGLIDECMKTGYTLTHACTDLMACLTYEFDIKDKPMFAGSSVHFDASFIHHWFGGTRNVMSHRYYDVTAIKFFCQSIGMPRLPKAEAHRAKADIEESIAHARACADWCTGVRATLDAVAPALVG